MTPPVTPLPSENTSDWLTRCVALVGAPGSVDIDDGMRSRQWEVLAINRSAGGNQPDTATLFRRLDRAGRMRNRTVAQLEPAVVEIWTVDPLNGELDKPLFWGEMDIRHMALSQGESETATASVRPFHFGQPLRGMQCWDADAQDTITVEFDAECNPMLDGRIIDNRLARATNDTPPYSLWFLPESARTIASNQYHDSEVPLPWDVAQVVETLCGWLNIDEVFITNPDVTDAITDAPDVRAITLKRGQYLPALLDAVLTPYGYGWFLDYVDDEGRAKPRIVVYQRGKGTQKSLLWPALDKHATLEHRADRVDLLADIANLANQVRCEGAVIERQCTITLYPAWNESDDETEIDSLTKSEDGANSRGIIGRKYVANEGGDYTGVRSGMPTPVGMFDSVFGTGEWVVRRRMVGDSILFESDDKSRHKPPIVEWKNPDGEWIDVDPSWGIRVLQDEIGVMLTANEVPADLFDQGANSRLRITGVIQGDKRLVATAERDDEHPQSNIVELVLDVSDQFADRQLHATGSLASVWAGDYIGATGIDPDERDDSAAIQSYADTIRQQRQPVAMMANISCFGLQLDWQIGDIITDITGRDIKLNRMPESLGTGRYLQVIGIDHDIASNPQRTTLRVTPYDV